MEVRWRRGHVHSSKCSAVPRPLPCRVVAGLPLRSEDNNLHVAEIYWGGSISWRAFSYVQVPNDIPNVKKSCQNWSQYPTLLTPHNNHPRHAKLAGKHQSRLIQIRNERAEVTVELDAELIKEKQGAPLPTTCFTRASSHINEKVRPWYTARKTPREV